MRKRWFFSIVFLLAACQQAVGTPVPTAVVPPTPVVEATPIQLPPATTTAQEEVVEETSEAETDPAVLAGCLRAEDVQYDLRAATQRLVDGGQAPNWEAPKTLQVKFVTGTTNATNTAFGCVYELRLWGERYDKFSDVQNVELFTSEDVLSLSAAIKAEFPEAQLTIFDWKDGLRSTVPDGQVIYSKYHGGFLLYIKK